MPMTGDTDYGHNLTTIMDTTTATKRSASTSRLVVPRTRCVTVGDRAFSVTGPISCVEQLAA